MGERRGRGIRPYGVFLRSLLDELQHALSELENLEFHHAGHSSPMFQHYLRVATWCDEVGLRMYNYDNAKRRSGARRLQALPGATPPEALVDETGERLTGSGESVRPRLGRPEPGC